MAPQLRRLAFAGPLAALALIAAACTPAPSLQGTATPPASIPSVSAEPSAPPPTSPEPSVGETSIRVYFMLGSFTGDGGLVPAPRSVPTSDDLASAALDALLAGPNESEMSARPAMFTAVPDTVRWLDLAIDGDTATVTVSSDFERDASRAILAQRVAQVVYTLTEFPPIQSVTLQIEGAPEPLGPPATREDYRNLLPAIWVDDPTWGGALPSGGHVIGLADVFEAQFNLMVLDADGRALVDMPVMASCGTGCRGSFDVTVDYVVTEPQQGTLRVYDVSEADGSPINVVDYPVSLTP